MENKEQDYALKVSEENPEQKHDSSTNEILQKENLIDPGNEHRHAVSENDKNAAKAKPGADSGSEATGTTGPEPGEGENDEPDTSGEAG